MKNHCDLTKVVVSSPFQYPDDMPEDIQQLTEEYIQQQIKWGLFESINKLLALIENEKNPQIILKVLMDNYSCYPSNGYKSEAAKKLGMSRQGYNYYVKRVKVIVDKLKE